MYRRILLINNGTKQKNMETITIGIGISENPLPDDKCTTKYLIFASECNKCGCSGRLIREYAEGFRLICENCDDIVMLSCVPRGLSDLTYIYWCNRSKFECDNVSFDNETQRSIKKLLDDYEKLNDCIEIPRWAVKIIRGKCQKSDKCLNNECIYCLK